MTPAQAKRAAFLLKVREDLDYELNTPKDSEPPGRDSDIAPLSRLKPDAKFSLDLLDNDGSMRSLAKMDVEMIRTACILMLTIVDTELRSLGIELE